MDINCTQLECATIVHPQVLGVYLTFSHIHSRAHAVSPVHSYICSFSDFSGSLSGSDGQVPFLPTFSPQIPFDAVECILIWNQRLQILVRNYYFSEFIDFWVLLQFPFFSGSRSGLFLGWGAGNWTSGGFDCSLGRGRPLYALYLCELCAVCFMFI